MLFLLSLSAAWREIELRNSEFSLQSSDDPAAQQWRGERAVWSLHSTAVHAFHVLDTLRENL